MTRARIAAALSIASLALLTGLAGCSGDSGTGTTEVEFNNGVTISVPNDLADQPPREFVRATFDSFGDQIGFSDEWRACLATELDAVPDARLDALIDPSDTEPSARAAIKLNERAAGECRGRVIVVEDPDATPEQIDALRALSAKEISDGAVELAQFTEEQATCISDRIEALSDDQMVKFANSGVRQQTRTITGWWRGCE